MKTFSQEDAMQDAMKSSTVYERNSEDDVSETRTFSYESVDRDNEDDDDEMSEPEIAASIEKTQSG